MTTHEQISQIETVASRAWPARDVEQYGGWSLRATSGVTRRANSVLPLGPPLSRSLDEAIEHAREFYERRGLPCIFQMTEASVPLDLDEALISLGFQRELEIDVETAPVSRIAAVPSRVYIRLDEQPTQEWFSVLARGGGYTESSISIRREIMMRIRNAKIFALALIDGQPVGTGLGVLDGELLGIFSIMTLPESRRCGVATSINAALANWGMTRGAVTAYLQVEENNHAAKSLYRSLGFERLYTYWYRVSSVQGH